MKKIIVLALAIAIGIQVGTVHAETNPDDAVVTVAEKAFLLEVSRTVLETYLKDGSIPDPAAGRKLSQRLTGEKGCFVTLEKRGSGLRGCIGYIMPVKSLYQSIIDNTVSAAVRDTRFRPVTAEELPDINIGISVLTVPAGLEFDSPDDLLAKLVPERDGVVLKTRYGKSTFLPQVWEQLPDKEQFLSRLCMKQGAPVDEWRKGGVTVLTYRAVVFKEKGFGGE